MKRKQNEALNKNTKARTIVEDKVLREKKLFL